VVDLAKMLTIIKQCIDSPYDHILASNLLAQIQNERT
jgi:hypothetical protein